MKSYLEFYGLEQDPFELTPDSDQVYMTGGYREALAIFLYAIKSRKGFAALYGKKGIGKSTLIRHVERSVDANTRILTLSEGNIPYHCLLKKILEKAGLPLKRESKGSMLHELYLYLIRSLAEGLNLVLIFDDAHELHAEVLEDLRLLSNLETSRSKLIQILFVGEPRLEEVLAADSMRQLRQRISIAHHIAPMTLDESMGYIVHRLRQSCSRGVYSVFTPEALSLITRCAAGIPERLDRLCHNSLVEGYIRNERQVTGIVVQAVRGEAEFKTFEAQVAPVRRPVRLIDRVRGEWLMPIAARFHDTRSAALALARQSTDRFHGKIPDLTQLRQTLSAARASAGRSTAQFRDEWLIPRMIHFRCFLSAAVASARQSTLYYTMSAAVTSVLLLFAVAQFPGVDLSMRSSSEMKQHEAQHIPASVQAEKSGRPTIADRRARRTSVQKTADLAGIRNSTLPVSSGAEHRYSRTPFQPARIVTVPKDATLTTLAVTHYGQSTPMLLDLILEMNPEITNIDMILHGQSLRLPVITDESAVLAYAKHSFKLHIGTFAKQHELRDLLQTLHLKSENIEIVPRKVSPSRTWYRVLVGPFPSQEECLTAFRKLRSNAKLVLAER